MICDAALEGMPIAIETDKAKTQHYELPTTFFKLVLGKHLKYRFRFRHYTSIRTGGIANCLV
jgi:cyclopropane fatty-acyl-phospholipid synthase-like methyltransferase